MSRILITGVTGMLGSKVFQVAREQGIDVYGTARRHLDPKFFPEDIYVKDRILTMEATAASAAHVLDQVKPHAVINCLGVIKQNADDQMMEINERFAHALADECTKHGIRFIEVSTDCVFSGKKGNYSEEDIPDPEDVYGKSKLAGEVGAPHLTIRTSIIGIERGAGKSLISWFLSNPPGSTIKGYQRAIWSGLTTRALAPILLDLAIGEHSHVAGLLHIASEPISKYDLLQLCRHYLKHDVNITEDTLFFCDRSLAHKRMDSLDIVVPSHEDMIAEMAEDR
jgi:dTDP-4-dehydrorhamnose reductase